MLLKRKQSQPEPSFNVLSLDSEDSQGETYVWCVAGHYNGREIKKVFHNRATVVKYLFHRRWPHTILTGMNLDYDLNTLKYRGGFNWDTIYSMGRLITAFPKKTDTDKFHLANHSIKIIDIGNYIQTRSLKQICDDFGIEGHINKHILGVDGSQAELEEACMSHADCGVKAFDYIQNQIHAVGGRIKLTSSSTALDMFMLNHLKEDHQIYDYKSDFPARFGLPKNATPDQIEIARLEKVTRMKETGGLAYNGGRCEAFNLGLYNNTTGIDINSSYPHQMRTQIYPDVNTCVFLNPTTTTLSTIMQQFEGCTHVKVYCPPMRIPIIPIRKDGKLIFPCGTFNAWVTFPELRLALKEGYKLLECHEAVVYKPITGLFDSYIDTMFKLKQEPATKFVGKLVMNGLSGKFGQKVPDNSGFQICHDFPDNGEIDDKQYFAFNNLIYEYITPNAGEKIEYVHTGYPILSAYILAYARIQLWVAMKAIGFDHVRYCDTDSIHADATAVAAAVKRGDINIHKTNLGAWSYDYQRGTIEIRGLKYYRYHERGEAWIYKIKGVRATAQTQYWLYKKGWMIRVRKIKTAIRTGLQANEFISIFRQDRLRDDKRIFTHRDSKPIMYFQ